MLDQAIPRPALSWRLDRLIPPAGTPRLAAGVLLVLLALRWAGIAVDPNALYADETQYWIWSRELDWGYFSKPPMIAWIIAATTFVFGDGDFGVRFAAPLLHSFTAVFLGLAAARLFNRQVGAWTSIVYITLPAVWLSASVISTDAVLLVFWSLGLYALARLRDGAGWGSALALGLAGGFAFLSKYAALYFFIGTALALLADAPTRRALVSAKGVAAAALTGAIILPNLLWNASHDFATVSHTAANANWGGALFNPVELGQFLIDQLGVFGPALFPALLAACIAAARAEAAQAARPRTLLALYVLPILVIVASQAFISRAHANWAAAAYGAGAILTTAFLLAGPIWRRRVLAASVALHTAAGLILASFALSPPLAEEAGLANAFKRVRAWPETAQALAQAVERTGADALVFDNRNDFHQMQRYGGAIEADLYMWLRYASAQNHAEDGWPLPADYPGLMLVASERPREIPLISQDFQRFEPAGEIALPLGGGRERRYVLFLAEGHEPLARDAAYEAAAARRDALQ